MGGRKFGGAGLGVRPWRFLVSRGVFGVGGKLLRGTVVSLEMPPAFISILYGFFFFSFKSALLKGNSSLSMLADLETAGSELTAQPAALALAHSGFVPLSIDAH